MKVLQVIDSLAYGGAERLLATLAEAGARDLDLEVASLGVRTPDRSVSLPRLQRAGLRPHFIGVRRLADPVALPRIRAVIKGSGCEVVHAHLGYASTLIPIAARQVGVPCVSTLHHVPALSASRSERVKDWLSIRSAERGDALIFVSAAAHDAAVRLYGIRRRTWRVIRNGVDLDALHPAPVGVRPALPADIAVPPGSRVVTIVAALRAPKGHDVAIRAWPSVRARVSHAVLLVVGDGPQRGALENMASAGSGIVFAGERGDVPEILRASDLALLPSFTEALPTALIEAAACGVPAVASRVGGVPETVADGETGVLVPPGNPSALADAVIDLLLDEPCRSRFGAVARDFATTRFDHRRWADELVALYKTAYANSALRRPGALPTHAVRPLVGRKG